jgi:branched-chain amino acid transport system substrate-binding protein
MKAMIKSIAVLVLALAASQANAEEVTLTIGATVTATGPAASLGIPEKNAIELMPKKIGNVAVRYVILDDGGDPGHAVRNARQLVEEYKADVILGSTTIPNSLAIGEVANQTQTPQIAMAPIPAKGFVFSLPQTADLMVEGLVAHMKAHGVKRAAYLGFADSLGDHNYEAFLKFAKPAGIEVVTNERYARNDTSVTAQVLRVIQAKPDAVFVSASGTPAALPQIELKQRGYKGQTYFLHGVINAPFLRVGGKSIEGAIATAGPFSVAKDLPDGNPIKQGAVKLIQEYDAKHGAGSANAFAAYAWDGFEIVKAALPAAMAKGKPGKTEFRVALREAIESGKEVVGVGAVYKMTKTDHNGLDDRARVLVVIKDGNFHPIR